MAEAQSIKFTGKDLEGTTRSFRTKVIPSDDSSIWHKCTITDNCMFMIQEEIAEPRNKENMKSIAVSMRLHGMRATHKTVQDHSASQPADLGENNNHNNSGVRPIPNTAMYLDTTSKLVVCTYTGCILGRYDIRPHAGACPKCQGYAPGSSSRDRAWLGQVRPNFDFTTPKWNEVYPNSIKFDAVQGLKLKYRSMCELCAKNGILKLAKFGNSPCSEHDGQQGGRVKVLCNEYLKLGDSVNYANIKYFPIDEKRFVKKFGVLPQPTPQSKQNTPVKSGTVASLPVERIPSSQPRISGKPLPVAGTVIVPEEPNMERFMLIDWLSRIRGDCNEPPDMDVDVDVDAAQRVEPHTDPSESSDEEMEESGNAGNGLPARNPAGGQEDEEEIPESDSEWNQTGPPFTREELSDSSIHSLEGKTGSEEVEDIRSPSGSDNDNDNESDSDSDHFIKSKPAKRIKVRPVERSTNKKQPMASGVGMDDLFSGPTSTPTGSNTSIAGWMRQHLVSPVTAKFMPSKPKPAVEPVEPASSPPPRSPSHEPVPIYVTQLGFDRKIHRTLSGELDEFSDCFKKAATPDEKKLVEMAGDYFKKQNSAFDVKTARAAVIGKSQLDKKQLSGLFAPGRSLTFLKDVVLFYSRTEDKSAPFELDDRPDLSVDNVDSIGDLLFALSTTNEIEDNPLFQIALHALVQNNKWAPMVQARETIRWCLVIVAVVHQTVNTEVFDQLFHIYSEILNL